VLVHLCGVRGSTPAPGREYVRYGGHTSCVALAHDAGPPTLVLDAGTGLRRLTKLLGVTPFRGTILLSHLHWDHVHGLPFFAAGDRPDSAIDVLLPAPDGDPVETLERGMSPPHFPIGPRDLGGGWRFRGLTEGRFELEGFTVLVREIPHKGGQTFGFRIDDGTASIAYLADHDPTQAGPGPDGLGEYHPAAMELAAGVDLLIHDAQFESREFPAVGHFGHAAIEYAVALATKAGAHGLALFHHAPERTDEQLDAIVARLPTGELPVFAATEGSVITLPVSDGVTR
jgi:phosphoribosyl 1,2-cyclic phosphodiesterase